MIVTVKILLFGVVDGSPVGLLLVGDIITLSFGKATLPAAFKSSP